MLETTMAGVIRNAKATSLKLWRFEVLVEKPWSVEASRQPSAPPVTPTSADSTTKETRIARR
jgi:hypothetical protein